MRDVSQWVNYGVRPSQFIFSPDSPFYIDNEDIVQKELDYLIETRPETGVWGITWSLYDEKHPKEFAISENWWKADLAIGYLKFLRHFDRLDSRWVTSHIHAHVDVAKAENDQRILNLARLVCGRTVR